MTAWPDSIPFFNLRSGYSAQPGSNVLRTPMDVGPAKVRRRSTSAPSVITGSAYMTREQAQRFEEFWRDTLFDGTLPFTKYDGLYRRRNLLVQSEDFSAGWTATGLVGSVAASVLPNGQSARRFRSDGSVGSPLITQAAGTFTGQTETLTAVAEREPSLLAAKSQLRVRNVTTATWIAIGEITWATLTIAATTSGTTVSLVSRGTGPNGGALVQASVTYAGTAGNERLAGYLPAGTVGVGVDDEATIIHWAQLEAAPAFTQYEPVGASYPATHVTRGGMKTYRIVGAPQFAPMGLGHRVSVSLEVLP